MPTLAEQAIAQSLKEEGYPHQRNPVTDAERALALSIVKHLRRACGYENITDEVRQCKSDASNGLVLDAAAEIERLVAAIASARAEGYRRGQEDIVKSIESISFHKVVEPVNSKIKSADWYNGNDSGIKRGLEYAARTVREIAATHQPIAIRAIPIKGPDNG